MIMRFAPPSFFNCFHASATTTVAIDPTEDEQGAEAISNYNVKVFSHNELKSATLGFRNKLGEGAFGTVYKGRLRGESKFIAVKVLSVEQDSLRGEKEFTTEVAALSCIKHENLVNLRGFCIHGTQRFLVYDHMENNSLAHTFLGTEQNRARFTWNIRKHVVLGIAKALCYLHEEVSPHLVHRDIKASNILLDHDFTPKLADFGLAKLFRESMSHISTRVAGTLGYLSPEYAYSGHLTRKSDVYSFGVLLLEIVSGQPVVDFHLEYGEQFLVEKAWQLYKANNLVELVDCALNSEFLEEEAIRFLQVGLLCVQETTKRRPSMSAAIKMLCNEITTNEIDISPPGHVADLMGVKIRQKHSLNPSSSPESSCTGSRYDDGN